MASDEGLPMQLTADDIETMGLSLADLSGLGFSSEELNDLGLSMQQLESDNPELDTTLGDGDSNLGIQPSPPPQPNEIVTAQSPDMTDSQKYQFLFGLLLMGALFLYQLQTSRTIYTKLTSSRKSVWIYMAFLSCLLLFYLFMMVYGNMHLVVNGFSVLPWWMLLLPTAIEMLTTFSLTVLRIVRLRAAFPITPLVFKLLVGGLVPLTFMSTVSLVANAVWTAGALGYEYLENMSALHPWNWEVGMMIASILADAAFLGAVSLATSRTDTLHQRPRLSLKTTLLIVFHIILSLFFVAQILISDASFGFTIYYVSVAAFPIDQRAFLQINNQVQRWFQAKHTGHNSVGVVAQPPANSNSRPYQQHGRFGLGSETSEHTTLVETVKTIFRGGGSKKQDSSTTLNP